MNNKQYSELTKYPVIFRNCYWGRISTSYEIDDEIILNRNAFAEEFDITEYVSNEGPRNGLGIFDHCELYKCQSGYVYIISHQDAGKDHDACAQQNGFMKYMNLYKNNSSTYIQKFSDKREFNRYMKVCSK